MSDAIPTDTQNVPAAGGQMASAPQVAVLGSQAQPQTYAVPPQTISQTGKLSDEQFQTMMNQRAVKTNQTAAQPIYTKVWFWVLTIVGLLLVGCIILSTIFSSGSGDVSDDLSAPTDYTDPSSDNAGDSDAVQTTPAETPASVSVPDLNNMTGDAAVDALRNQGLQYNFESNDGKAVLDYRNWTVIGQDPAAGTVLSGGSTVTVAVAKLVIEDGYSLTAPDAISAQYVEGYFRNISSEEFSYVQIEFGLYAADGTKVGTAMTNESNVGPGVRVAFKALGIASGAAGVRAEIEDITYY